MEDYQVPSQKVNTKRTPDLARQESETEEVSSHRTARSETPAKSDMDYESSGSSNFEAKLDAIVNGITDNLEKIPLSQSSDNESQRSKSADFEQKTYPHGNGDEDLESSRADESRQETPATYQNNNSVLPLQRTGIEQDSSTLDTSDTTSEGSQYTDAEEELSDTESNDGLYRVSQTAGFEEFHGSLQTGARDQYSRPAKSDQEFSNTPQNHTYVQGSQPDSQQNIVYDGSSQYSGAIDTEDALGESSHTQGSPSQEYRVPEFDNSLSAQPQIPANNEEIDIRQGVSAQLLNEILGDAADEHSVKMEVPSPPHILAFNEDIDSSQGAHTLNEVLDNVADEHPIKKEVLSPTHIPYYDEPATPHTWPSQSREFNQDLTMTYGAGPSHQVDSGTEELDKLPALEKSDDIVIARRLSEQHPKDYTLLPNTGDEDSTSVSTLINPQDIADSRTSGPDTLSQEQHQESFSSNESLHFTAGGTLSTIYTSKETTTPADSEIIFEQNRVAHPETETMHEDIPATENADVNSRSLPMNGVNSSNEIDNQLVSTPINIPATIEAPKIDQVPDNIKAAAGNSNQKSRKESSVQLEELSANSSQPENDEVDQINLEPELANSQVHDIDQNNTSMEEDSATLHPLDYDNISKLSSPEPEILARELVGNSAPNHEIKKVATSLTSDYSQAFSRPPGNSNDKKAPTPKPELRRWTIESFTSVPKESKSRSSKAEGKTKYEFSSPKTSKKSTLIDLSNEKGERTEDPDSSKVISQEAPEISLETNNPKTKPDTPASKKKSKIYNLDDDEESSNNKVAPSKDTQKKEAAIDLTQPDNGELSGAAKRGRGRPKSVPKESKSSTIIKEESNTEPQSLFETQHKAKGGGKRNTDKLEPEQVPAKRQKANAVQEDDLEFVVSKSATKQEPILGGINTRRVQRSAAPMPEVVLKSRKSTGGESIHILDDDEEDDTSVPATVSTQNSTPAKLTASKRKAKQPPVNTSQKRPSSLVIGLPSAPLAKKAKVGLQPKITGRGSKTALTPVVENKKGIEKAVRSVECKEKPEVALRHLTNSTPGFPRFPMGDVYISLSVRDELRSYCLHSETLARLSPWFRNELTKVPPREPSEELRSKFNFIARFELTVDPETSEPALMRVPLTMYIDKSELGRTQAPSSENAESQLSLRGGIISYDGSNENSPISISSKERRLRNDEKNNEINDSIEQAEENIKEQFYEAYDNLFRAYYSLPLSVDSRQLQMALQQTESAVDLAEKFKSLPAIRPHLTTHLFNFQRELYKAIAREPPRWFWLAMKLNSAPIYKEAMLHVVGNYPKWQDETILLVRDHHYDVEPLILMKVKKFREFKAAVDHDLSASSISIDQKPLSVLGITDDESYHTWLVIQCWKDWYNCEVVETKRASGNATSSEIYQLMLLGGDAYLPLETVLGIIENLRARKLTDAEVDQIEEDLAKMKGYAQYKVQELCLNNSMVVAADEGITHFTCLEVSDDELPWPAPNLDPTFT